MASYFLKIVRYPYRTDKVRCTLPSLIRLLLYLQPVSQSLQIALQRPLQPEFMALIPRLEGGCLLGALPPQMEEGNCLPRAG